MNDCGRCSSTILRLDRKDWFLRVPVGALCLSVHIPPTGELSREACAESYKRAIEVFRPLFPDERIVAFTCKSWMMAPELKEFLKPDSRILAFQEPYLKYPIPSRGRDIFNFVFKEKSADCDYASDLAENFNFSWILRL